MRILNYRIYGGVTHGSLFSGIGGFDLAAQWMGWNNVFHCEINPFGRQVLNYYWPDAISYEDITKTDFSIHRGRIDVLTGGFPCQPFSLAGKRKGTEDDRHLWPEMLRAIREIKPRWIVGENVYGLVNWDGGLVFDQVQADLENEGYEVQPYILPAAGVNAPHKRDRVWFVAYRSDAGAEIRSNDYDEQGERRESAKFNNRSPTFLRDVTNPSNKGLQGRKVIGSAGSCRQEQHKQPAGRVCPDWEKFPTQSPVRGRNDGISSELVGITVPRHRNESIKAYGNAIVPQVVLQIFKAIEEYERRKSA